LSGEIADNSEVEIGCKNGALIYKNAK